MIFTELKLQGVFVVDIERRGDDRGFFARVWCTKEFESCGLRTSLVQSNLAFSKKRDTLRGLHYQIAPYEEAKLVRCVRGAIYDVIIDLRPKSPTYRNWLGVELTAENYKMLYVPEGFAHGYQTLRENTEVFYQVSQMYAPEFERGIRWNDAAFGISWPEVESAIVSDKDKNWPDYGV